MKITIDFDLSDSKALALLNYIRTLDFITIKEIPDELYSYQKQAIDKGIEQLDEGQKITHEQVLKESKERYPNLFE